MSPKSNDLLVGLAFGGSMSFVALMLMLAPHGGDWGIPSLILGLLGSSVVILSFVGYVLSGDSNGRVDSGESVRPSTSADGVDMDPQSVLADAEPDDSVTATRKTP